MNNTFPIYDVVIDDNSIGLTAISLVDYPAIMTDFIAFKEQKMQEIWMSSNEKREVVSPILIPNQLILRKAEDGSLYYIRWTEKTIELAAKRYLANGFFNNFTVMHPTFYNKDMKYEDALEKDVYMLRLWTIEDPEKDDANTKYGFSLPKGTLMVHFRVVNRKIWQRIKSGELKGCSIEAFTNIARSDNEVKINTNMSKLDVTNKQMSLFQKFIQFLNEVSAEAKDISDVAKKDEADSGEVSLKYWLDDEHYIEVDAEGFARDEEYNLVAEGEYKLADGNVIVVGADNKLARTKAVGEGSEEEPVEAPIAEKKIEEEEDEKKDEEPKEETDGEPGDAESEGEPVGDTEDAEAPAEEKPEEEPVEDIPAEEPVEETPIEDVPEALLPFEIDGVEYLLPQPVIDYINSLKGEGDEIKAQLMQMKENTPSVNPIPTVIAQLSSEDGGLYDAIRRLNYKN